MNSSVPLTTRRRKQGFTIIELIVVIAVIGILAGIVILSYGAWKKSTIENTMKSDLTQVKASITTYLNWNESYPSSGSQINGGQGPSSSNGNVITYQAKPYGYCATATNTVTTNVFRVRSINGGNVEAGTCDVMVASFAGTTANGYLDGDRTVAQFGGNGSAGIAVDSVGVLYIADKGNNRIRKITPDGAVSTIAGSGVAGSTDGVGTSAQFNGPTGIAVDTAGNLYVTDGGGWHVRKITPDGTVSTLAGSTQGHTDGAGATAQFYGLNWGIAVDTAGNVYIAETGYGYVRKITPSGTVSTLVSGLSFPRSIAVDTRGNLYVTETGNNRVDKITPSGSMSVLAGSGVAGSVDGTGTAAQFYTPWGIAVDARGTVYVVEYDGARIRTISPSGVVTTIAGSTSGYVDGVGTTAKFWSLSGIAVDSSYGLHTLEWGGRVRNISQ